MTQPYRDDRDVLQLRIEELRAESTELAEAVVRGTQARARLPELHLELLCLERRLRNGGEAPRGLSGRWVWALRGGTVALATTLLGGWYLSVSTFCGKPKTQSAKVGAEAIRGAVELWQADGNPSRCPDVDALVVGKTLDGKKTLDPWGTPWRIECGDEEVRVWSNGKDRTARTADDIADDFKPSDIKRVADL